MLIDQVIISEGETFGKVDRVSLTHALHCHQVGIAQPQKQTHHEQRLQKPACPVHAQSELLREVWHRDVQSMRVGLVLVLHVAVLEDGEGVQKGSMAVSVSEEVVSPNLAQEETFVLLHLDNVLAGVHALPHRNDLLSSVRYYPSAVFAASEVVALGLEPNMPSALPQFLEDTLEVVDGFHAGEVLVEGVGAIAEAEVEQVRDAHHLGGDPGEELKFSDQDQ
jgi:hypothetical protein